MKIRYRLRTNENMEGVIKEAFNYVLKNNFYGRYRIDCITFFDRIKEIYVEIVNIYTYEKYGYTIKFPGLVYDIERFYMDIIEEVVYRPSSKEIQAKASFCDEYNYFNENDVCYLDDIGIVGYLRCVDIERISRYVRSFAGLKDYGNYLGYVYGLLKGQDVHDIKLDFKTYRKFEIDYAKSKREESEECKEFIAGLREYERDMVKCEHT